MEQFITLGERISLSSSSLHGLLLYLLLGLLHGLFDILLSTLGGLGGLGWLGDLLGLLFDGLGGLLDDFLS